jgi:hypothetical protein
MAWRASGEQNQDEEQCGQVLATLGEDSGRILSGWWQGPHFIASFGVALGDNGTKSFNDSANGLQLERWKTYLLLILPALSLDNY